MASTKARCRDSGKRPVPQRQTLAWCEYGNAMGGAMLLETEKRFYCIRGYREMLVLAVILKQIVDIKEVAA